MAYSHSRLRKMLALVRILTGAVFFSLGVFKVSSLEFAKIVFPAFLETAARGGAAEWFRPMMTSILNSGPGKVGVMFGFIELTIGVSLLLGLAVRPACLLGMAYSGWLLLATWNPVESSASMLQTTEYQFRNLFPMLVLLLLGVGHAGETWGVGSLYHHRRARRWTTLGAPEARPVVKEEEFAFYEEPRETMGDGKKPMDREPESVEHSA